MSSLGQAWIVYSVEIFGYIHHAKGEKTQKCQKLLEPELRSL